MAEEKKLTGIVKAEVVEARFAYSGKVVNVYKRPGDTVKIGDFLASLDRKLLQTVLDKELADYEKVRAEFEIFALNNPNPGDDKTKYLKTESQAALNASVKAVEIAKYNLDEADLKSPVNGIVLENDGIRTEMYVTPGSYAYQLLDTDSTAIETEIENEEKELFTNKAVIMPNMKGKLIARIKPENTEGLIPGKKTTITV